MTRLQFSLLVFALAACFYLPDVLAQTGAGASEDSLTPLEPLEPAPKKELKKQEPQLDTYDPSIESQHLPKTVRAGEPLKLEANAVEQHLAIEWDAWHNAFAKAVRAGMFSNQFEMINLKSGTGTMYHCDVTAGRLINNLNITSSSGDFWFNDKVIKAIKKLEGTETLAFPARSTRSEVSVDLGITYGGRARRGELIFNDTEFRQLSPGEIPEENKPEPAPPPPESKKRKRHNKSGNAS